MSTTDLETPASAPDPFDPWFADRIATTAARGGQEARTALVERAAGRRGVMPPLYAHREDETFRVLAGEVTFFVGDEVTRAGAGDLVVAPAEVPRTYRVETDGARWLVLTRVVSVSRFEDFGRALAQPFEGAAAGWTVPEEARSLEAIAGVNGIRVLGPPGMLPADLSNAG